MITIEPHRGYMSERAGILDWVERGCERLMRAGGGPLSQEQPYGKQRGPRRQLDGDTVLKLEKEGRTQREISQMLGKSYSTINGFLRRHGVRRYG